MATSNAATNYLERRLLHYIFKNNSLSFSSPGDSIYVGLATAVSAAETVQAGAKLLVNTNGGGVTITLPASPATGDEVHFVDQGYDFDSNALTVGRNSSNIANAASDLVVNTQGAAFGLVFSGDATTGWTYTEK